MMLHYSLAPGARVVQETPRAYNVFAYVFGGSGTFGSNQRGGSVHQMVRFANDGLMVRIRLTIASIAMRSIIHDS
jgi:quercetin 2,3-dioxygenase